MNASYFLKQWHTSLKFLADPQIKRYKWLFFPFLGLCLAAGGAVSRQFAQPMSAAPSAQSALVALQELSAESLLSPPEQVPVAPVKPPASQTPDQAAPVPAAPDQAPAQQQAAVPNVQLSMASIDAFVDMKVGIAEGVPSLTVGTSGQADVLSESGELLYSLAPGEMHSVQPSGDGLLFGGTQLPAVVIVNLAPTDVFYLGDRAYRGRLLLAADGGQLWAVNFVDMQSYLYSVVGSEVSASWNMEALKAQAVAARSYALTYRIRPINSVYNLGATEYYQVYKGVATEDERIKQAVDATAGQFVSYRGGVVESLYAASDEIVMEAFQGAGMSQLGALDLANQGFTYTQILANYYPGTYITQLAIDTH